MKQISMYFKSDFTVILASEGEWGGAPFRLKLWTASPAEGRSIKACFDGEVWHNCRLLDDGRLQISVNQGDLGERQYMGIGTLKMDIEFYLSNQDFNDHYCNEHIKTFEPVFEDENGEQYKLFLDNQGASTLVTYGTLPAFYMKGDKGDPGTTTPIDTELNPENADNEHAAGALVTAKKFSELPNITAGTGDNSFIIGQSGNTASDKYSSAFGHNCKANGYAAFASGNDTTAGDTAHSEGYQSKATGLMSHAEGNNTTASAQYSHAEGSETLATGNTSHAEGNKTKALGWNCHAEGDSTTAGGTGDKNNAHAEGHNTQAINLNAHAEGDETVASGFNAHAEGYKNQSIGNNSHTEGRENQANGNKSHAEGEGNIANGEDSHAEGKGNTTTNIAEHASGCYNESHTGATDAEITLFSIGNGTNTNRRNAFEVMRNGDIYIYKNGNRVKLQDLL